MCWLENATWPNLLTKIFPILLGKLGFWEIDSKGKGIQAMKQWVDPGVGRRVFKIVATSICCPFCQLRRKVSRVKINTFIHILKYFNQRLKFQTQIWISNFIGAKFFRWHLGINSIWRRLGYSMRLDILIYSFGGLFFAFPCWGLLCFYFIGELHKSSKVQDCLLSPWPNSQLRTCRRLNNRLCVGWKTLTN